MDVRHLKGIQGSDEGFSLVELVIVSTLLSVVIGIAFMLFNSTVGMSDRIETRSYLTEDTRLAVDLMTRELRQASEISDGAGVFGSAQARTCIFYVDLNHDYAPERVSYFMNGSKLVRTQASPTTLVPPFSYGADGAQRTLIATMSPTFTGPVFTYYNSSGTVLTSSQSAQCSAVGLHIVSTARVRGTQSEYVTVDLATWVKIRAVFNNIQ
jgi:prepilin-type N-terminal cleavage/methylation domain-containing protein